VVTQVMPLDVINETAVVLTGIAILS